MKNRNYFWGLFWLCCAALILTNQIGLFRFINPGRLIFTILMAAIIIKAIRRKRYWDLGFPIIILYALYAEFFHLPTIKLWSLFLIALFTKMGLSMIFKGQKQSHHRITDHYRENHEDIEEDIITSSVSFGSDIKYIQSQCLQKAKFDCSFGSLKIFLDQAALSPGGAEIDFDVSFSSVEIYVPHTWDIIDEISASIGSVRNIYPNNYGGPKLILTGEIAFGNIDIHYIRI